MNPSDYIYKRSIIPLLLTLLITGCTIDTDRFGPDEEKGEEIAFTLWMPVQSTGTRAMSEEDENRVNQVDILIFRPFDNQFVEVVSTDQIEDVENEINLKTFYVRLRGETTLNLVILGNSQDILRTAFPDDEDMKGLTKDEILSELILAWEGPWVDPQGKAIRPFPMWGFRDNANVKEDDFTGEENAIRMTRMVVRIDVHVSDAAQDEFKLNEVYLYNSYLSGKLVHSMTNGWDATEHKATAPDIPATATSKWRVDYIDSPSPITTADISSERVIYTLEAPKGDENALLETTALVVGGIYDNEQYYYRVDFAATNKEGKIDFIPLVRNHNYEIHIQEVKGKGYATPDDAFRKGMTNMELDILAWNEAGMGDITFGAQFQLTVNTDSFFFYSNGREQILKVYTDHPDGWVVVKEHESDLPWLKINPLMGDPGESVEIKLSAEELTTPLTDRSGYFYIQAGHLKKKIKVSQSLEAELYLEVEPNLLIFRRSAVSPETITVTVDPDTQPVYLSWTGTDQFKWRTDGWPATGQTGVTEYVFRPEPNNSRNLLTGTITFSVSDETGKTTSRTVTVIHLPTDTRFDVEYQYDLYPAIGGDPLWMITSAESEWQITQNNITLGGFVTDHLIPENYDLRPAENFKYYNFKLEPNPLFEERTFNLHVTSPDPAFAPVDVPLVQDYTRPLLKINSPQDLNIRFTHESDLPPVEVVFDVNTNWKYTATGNYGTYIHSSVPANTEQTGGTIHHPQEMKVTFTPTIFKPELGTPEGGSEWKGTVTFTTTNHAPATESTATINFSQVVPHLFDRSKLIPRRTNSPTGEVFQDGDRLPDDLGSTTIYLETATNTHWSVEARHAGRGNEYFTYTHEFWNHIRVPFRFTTTKNESFYDKEITLYLMSYRETVDGVTVTHPAEKDPFLTLYQDPYYYVDFILDPAFENPDFVVPYTGGSYEFKMQGRFPATDHNSFLRGPAVAFVNSYNMPVNYPLSTSGMSGEWLFNQGVNPGESISFPVTIGQNWGNSPREYFLAYKFGDNILLERKEWTYIFIRQEGRPAD